VREEKERIRGRRGKKEKERKRKEIGDKGEEDSCCKIVDFRIVQ
jgi:hypothetical protein